MVAACLTWAVTSAAGLLAASRLAFDALCVAGACYLLWLGGRALWNARRRTRDRAEPPEPRSRFGHHDLAR